MPGNQRGLASWRWVLILLAALVLGVMLMGQPPDRRSSFDELLALAGLGLIVGGWLLATRGSTLFRSEGQRLNDQMLAETLQSLAHFETVDLHTRAGAIYLDRGDRKRAEKHLKRAIEVGKPSDLRARYLLGHLYLRVGQPKDAWTYFDQVYRANPDYQLGEIKLAAAETYLALREPEVAIGLVDGYLVTNRGHLPSLALKAQALWDLKRMPEAQALYREILQGIEGASQAQRTALRPVEKLARKRAKTS